MKNHASIREKKIATLFKSEVRKINIEYTAGAERVWLKDILLLKKKYKQVKIYAAADINFPKEIKSSYYKIPYPHHILDFLAKQKEESRINVIKKTSAYLYYLFLRVFEIYYAVFFLLKEFSADYYYTYQCPLVGVTKPKKTIVMFHNFVPNLMFSKIFKTRYKKITFLFCSQALKNEFRNNFPHLASSNWRVLYNSVDTKMFTPYPKKKSSKKIVFAYLSDWSKLKGLHYFLRAIEIINQRYSDRVIFHIAGSADLWDIPLWVKKEREALAKEVYACARRNTNVKIIGKIPYRDLPRFYNKIHYTVFPSLWNEPFGNIVIESMACGTPVIAFKRGEPKEIITNEIDGYLMSNPSVKSLANQIEHIVRKFSSKLYSLMQNKAHNKIVQKFSDKIRERRLYLNF